MNRLEGVLGIDTSNYTSSAAIFTPDGRICTEKKLLTVPQGGRGLRQSEALFQHTVNLPEILKNVFSKFHVEISAVGVSSKPRDAEDSYMPCFLAGVSAASAASAVKNCPVYQFSHQRGHIMAALYSADKLPLVHEPFLAFHVSGGTTELLLVTPDDELIIKCCLLAHTLDLNAGQVIDRVGVMMGFSFPAGKEIDRLSQRAKKLPKVRPTLKDGNCCLSGVENICKKMYDRKELPEDIAATALLYVLESVSAMTGAAQEKYGMLPVVFAGGVMSNTLIRQKLSERFDCAFAEPEFSCDNAAGIAILTAMKKGIINI